MVARDERATAASVDGSDESTGDAAAASDSASGDADAAASSGDDTASESDDSGGDDDRGGRGDTTARDVDLAEGFGLGGAEQLQGLLDDCQDGNDLACDILLTISAFDSPEEGAAISCGGRAETSVAFCTAGFDAGEDGLVFDPNSQGLDRVVEACQVDGNMTACDFLYYRSPLDSEYQAIGDTCGGRVNVAVPDCRSMIDG